ARARSAARQPENEESLKSSERIGFRFPTDIGHESPSALHPRRRGPRRGHLPHSPGVSVAVPSRQPQCISGDRPSHGPLPKTPAAHHSAKMGASKGRSGCPLPSDLQRILTIRRLPRPYSHRARRRLYPTPPRTHESARTTRNPIRLVRIDSVARIRAADRNIAALSLHPPPRATRMAPCPSSAGLP